MVEPNVERVGNALRKRWDERNRPPYLVRYLAAQGEEKSTDESGADEAEAEDRGRGILTPADRAFLLGDRAYAHVQTETNKRAAIRERIQNALLDFQLLFWQLREKDREKLFDSFTPAERYSILPACIGFLYQGLDRDVEALEQCVETGVHAVEFVTAVTSDEPPRTVHHVDVDIDIAYDVDTDALHAKLERGEFLFDHELGALIRYGDLSPADLQRIQEQAQLPEPAE